MSSRNYGKGNYGLDLDLSTTLVPIVCFVFYEMWAGYEKKLPFRPILPLPLMLLQCSGERCTLCVEVVPSITQLEIGFHQHMKM